MSKIKNRLPNDLYAIHESIQNDLIFYAKNHLLIVTKSGSVVPFKLNYVQNYIHDQLEDQLRTTGKVRALVLKCRQPGCSTYVAGRFFHKTTQKQGKRTFILSHDSKTTGELFKIVKRFHERLPNPVKPVANTSNLQQLIFSAIESSYTVGTAGNVEVGRGLTLQYLHGSEVAFWPNGDKLMKGVGQAVADMPGTEIILESTANGMTNEFYRMCMQAIKGRGDYRLIFIPWFWHHEYVREVPDNFVLSDEELQYQKTYDLTDEQMAWRQAKLENWGGIENGALWKFKQEYPANPMEAFETSGDSLIKSEFIMAARKSKLKDRNAPLVMGIDKARSGDRTVIAFRRGREVPKCYAYTDMNEMRLAGIAAQLIDKHKPKKCFVDITDGWGCVDRLHELGYRDIVDGIHFGSKATQEDLYVNKRVEMWISLRDWFHQDGEKNIPDEDEIQADLTAIPDAKEQSNGKKYLVSKDKIKEAYGGKSPDYGDALALTFAFPVRIEHNNRKHMSTNKSQGIKAFGRMRKNDQDINETSIYIDAIRR